MGIEPTPETPENTAFPTSSGAKSGAPSFLTPTTDPNLLILIEAWPALPEALKIGILAMVKTAGKG